MQEYFKPQINTLTDRANFVLYGTANAALCVGIGYFVGSPKLMTAAFVASSAFGYMAAVGHNGIMKRNFPPTPETELSSGSKELPVIIAQLSDKFGIHPPTPIHVTKARTREEILEDVSKDHNSHDEASRDETGNKFENKIVEAYKKHTNALTYGTKKSGIVVSGALTRLLAPKEQAVLMAHELGHQAAHHLQKTTVQNLLANTATFAASANVVLTVLSSWTGWVAPALGYVVATKSVPIANRLVTKIGGEENISAVTNVCSALGVGAMFGAAYFTHNPKIIEAWFVGQAANVTAKFLNAGYSRCNEYQADRLATEAIGDPLFAAASMKKIYIYSRVLSNKLKDKNSLSETGIHRMFRKAGQAFLSHPKIKKRIRRIERMARASESIGAGPV